MEYFSTTNSKNNPTLVFLHGWGGSWASWSPILERLKENFNLFAFDLPGFGNQKIDKSFNLDDYINFVIKILKTRKIKNPILIGHSFGGAIASKIAAKNLFLIKKLILVDSATIRHPYTQSQKTKFKVLGILKKFFPFARNFYYKITKLQNSDYAAIKNNPLLQKTFQNVIQTDLSSIISKIKTPTLIIWGGNDADTPLVDGQKINYLIPKSKLIIYPNSSHFSYLENQDTFVSDIKKFIQK
jgi:pimeloyl-ACP methyl ester carboxylesterase